MDWKSSTQPSYGLDQLCNQALPILVLRPERTIPILIRFFQERLLFQPWCWPPLAPLGWPRVSSVLLVQCWGYHNIRLHEAEESYCTVTLARLLRSGLQPSLVLGPIGTFGTRELGGGLRSLLAHG